MENTKKTNDNLESVKFSDLTANKWYDVKKSGFRVCESKKSKDKFISYWFIITSGTVTKITSVTGDKANKALAITFNCKNAKDGKNGFNIKSLRRTERNNYDDVQFIIEPWTVESMNTDEFETLDTPF